MNMESNNDKASKLTKQARLILVRYVFTLVIVYIGFVVMTSLSNLSDSSSVMYIEIVLFLVIVSVLGLVIYKTALAAWLFKQKEEWR